MTLRLITFALVTGLATGCASTHVSRTSATIDTHVKAPLRADIEIGPKVQGASTTYIILGLFSIGSSQYADGVDYGVGGLSGFLDFYGDAKSSAAYDATVKHNADVIIAPRYVIEEEDYLIFKRVDVVVEGYHGAVRGIR